MIVFKLLYIESYPIIRTILWPTGTLC